MRQVVERGFSDRITKLSRPLPAKPRASVTKNGRTITIFLRKLCPGIDGKPCRWGNHLNNKSTLHKNLPICVRCLEELMKGECLVSPDAARTHLLRLKAAGLGRRAIADTVGLSYTIVDEIGQGKAKRIRKDTEERILSMRPEELPDGAHISATRSMRLIQEMLDFGLTREAISSKLLGHPVQSLQLKEHLTVARAREIRRLHREVFADGGKSRGETRRMIRQILKTGMTNDQLRRQLRWRSIEPPGSKSFLWTELWSKVKDLHEELVTKDEPGVPEDCECGLSHEKPDRLKRLLRMLPCTTRDVWEAYPCIYPLKTNSKKRGGENRMLQRDLAEIAVKKDGFWHQKPTEPSTPEDPVPAEGSNELSDGLPVPASCSR